MIAKMATFLKQLLPLVLAGFLCLPTGRAHAAQPGEVLPVGSEAGTQYVRAVVFWEPECQFCRQVVEQDLPSLIEPFGQQVQILYIDLNVADGEAIYQAALAQFEVAQAGIPMLVIGQTVLQGSQIAQQLPGLIEQHLDQSGVDWPPIPGLEGWLAALPPSMSQPLGSAACTDCELSATQAAVVTPARGDQPTPATAAPVSLQKVVRAVLFWMQGCPHCHEVLEQVLPPLQARYGNQLQIVQIELAGAAEVTALYELADSLAIPKNQVGVPFLVIGENVLIGASQIPAELPGLIEAYLANGGVDFPDFPALAPYLPTATTAKGLCAPSAPCEESTAIPATPVGTEACAECDLTATRLVAAMTAQSAQRTQAAATTTVTPAIANNGFTLAIIVLIGMVAAVLYSIYAFLNTAPQALPGRPTPGIEALNLILLVAGAGVAGYLAYIETQGALAICGPVGDCNAVQHSPYARLFGILPIGVLGVIGYLAILAAWVVRRTGQARWAKLAALAIFGMTLGGTLFSLYLTYLEPFVIQAVCIWCITSAVIMTLLLLINVKPASLSIGMRSTPNDQV